MLPALVQQATGNHVLQAHAGLSPQAALQVLQHVWRPHCDGCPTGRERAAACLPAMLCSELLKSQDGEFVAYSGCSVRSVLTCNIYTQVVGCIVEHEGRVLLCRRAIEPCTGLWTVPAGFLEMGESTAAGAARETWEEANARVEARFSFQPPSFDFQP